MLVSVTTKYQLLLISSTNRATRVWTRTLQIVVICCTYNLCIAPLSFPLQQSRRIANQGRASTVTLQRIDRQGQAFTAGRNERDLGRKLFPLIGFNSGTTNMIHQTSLNTSSKICETKSSQKYLFIVECYGCSFCPFRNPRFVSPLGTKL